uniref:Mesogenin-1 n=1 Tax=Geotrypetes seraphini TaxID=260995 RepID=A0A6P8Q572_GEOSA|nr:mesogenin-1 [Geotrypetes seraphini]
MAKLHPPVTDCMLDSDPDALFSTWKWKFNPETCVLSLVSSPQSLSPLSDASLESSSSPSCSAVAEVPCGNRLGYGFVDFPPGHLQSSGHDKRHQRSPKRRMSVQRRRKASEREKLRMRNLAEALLTLRNFLPPIYSQGGRPLTKIQTLKYTIRYIRELSELVNTLKE